MLYADGPHLWRFLSQQIDLKLSAFLVWTPSAPLRAQYEVASARLPNIIHRHLLILDQPSQFDLPRLMTSDVAREEGTSGHRTYFGSALRAAAPQTLTATPSDKCGSQVGIQIVQVMWAIWYHKGQVITSEAQLAAIFG